MFLKRWTVICRHLDIYPIRQPIFILTIKEVCYVSEITNTSTHHMHFAGQENTKGRANTSDENKNLLFSHGLR